MRCKDKTEMINGNKNDFGDFIFVIADSLQTLFHMHHPQQILPAVAAAIFNDKGEILLQKRKDVSQWCIISGHVEFGETIEAAI